MTRILKTTGGTLLILAVVASLVVTIAPRFLDRIYHKGPDSAGDRGAGVRHPHAAGGRS